MFECKLYRDCVVYFSFGFTLFNLGYSETYDIMSC